MIQVKVAKPKDALTLSVLGKKTYIESHGHYINDQKLLMSYCDRVFSVEKIKEEIQDSNIIFWIAFDGDFAVGYVQLIINEGIEHIKSDNISKLERIYVLDEYIPKKVGQQLQNQLLNYTRELGKDFLWLRVYVKNQRAIRFYQKNGFKDVGKTTFYVENKGFDNHVLSLEL